MTLNNLLAAPGFASWLEGEPLDVGRLLYTADGKPRVSIFSIAHLCDAERMFFVSLLLNEIARLDAHASPGTTSLRALLYMDEIFGYLPPVANPPSKKPLLTLLKQARAFGVGVVLATQNPVDLDYKALVERRHLVPRPPADRARQGAGARRAGGRGRRRPAARFDRGADGQTLAGLGKRVFLLHNVHDDAPVVFETRWALSYLAGPLTRLQIARLTEERRRAAGEKGDAPAPAAASPADPTPASVAGAPTAPAAAAPGAPAPPAAPRPVLPPGIDQRFLPFRGRPEAGLVYRPHLLGLARVHFADDKRGVDQADEVALLAPFAESSAEVDWYGAATLELGLDDLEAGPADAGAAFAPLPGAAADPKRYAGWEKDLGDALYRTRSLDLFSWAALSAVSKPGESERDFRIRLAEAAREERDRRTAALRQKYAKQAATFEERKRRAEQKVAVQREQSQQAKLQTAVSFGATLLGAFLGRKSFSAGTLGRASTAVRGVSRSMKESQDVARAREDLAAVQQSLADLDAQLKVELDALAASYDPTAIALEPLAIKPRRSDVEVRKVALAWAPYRPGAGGAPEPAWE